jgi:hypothetical protein
VDYKAVMRKSHDALDIAGRALLDGEASGGLSTANMNCRRFIEKVR